MATYKEVWGFNTITTGGFPGVPTDAQVWTALADGARERGIDPTQPSDALDASRDVIVDDVLRGVVGDLRRCGDWVIQGDTLFAVWDGMPLESLISHQS
ncbi:hypothetical protein [Rhodococcus pyridinivorans]|uniref:hypothetical protein n=1 Tax=Rhodococcus pyridinivorans TaxID=103816 RepID=UPI00265A22AA|nr:hypothetical protein [Rhodococcus pyridinivorans]